jgi:hypothetical protein
MRRNKSNISVSMNVFMIREVGRVKVSKKFGNLEMRLFLTEFTKK